MALTTNCCTPSNPCFGRRAAEDLTQSAASLWCKKDIRKWLQSHGLAYSVATTLSCALDTGFNLVGFVSASKNVSFLERLALLKDLFDVRKMKDAELVGFLGFLSTEKPFAFGPGKVDED